MIYLLMQLYLCIRKYYTVWNNRLLCEKLEKLMLVGLKRGFDLALNTGTLNLILDKSFGQSNNLCTKTTSLYYNFVVDAI